METFPEQVSGFTFLNAISEGNYGCTFLVQLPETGIKYALKVEKFDPNVYTTIEDMMAEITTQIRVAKDTGNSFQLRIKNAYFLDNDILPLKIQQVMERNCRANYDKWRRTNFRGTYSFALMELGLSVTQTLRFGRNYTREFAFGVCFALYRLNQIGIMHRDVRLPNILIKQSETMPVILNGFEYEPSEGAIPALIDYGLALVNPEPHPFTYVSSGYLQNSDLLYGPTIVSQLRVDRQGPMITYNNRVDYWMVALVLCQLYAPTLDYFWDHYNNTDYYRVPESVREGLGPFFRTSRVAALWSMALLSDAFEAFKYIPDFIYEEVKNVRDNPFSIIVERMDLDLQFFVSRLLSWNVTPIDGTKVLQHFYFRPLRFDSTIE